MRGSTLLIVGLAAIGLFGIVATVMGSSRSVRDHVAGEYRFVRDEPVPGDDDVTKVYSSPDSISRTAEDIADAKKPGDRHTTEAGQFLRYSDDIVAVVPPDPGGTGSLVMVSDEDTGYRHHFFYVGGWWGRYSGPAESFRGGGPGGGK